MSHVLVAKEAFVATVDGVEVVVSAGQPVRADAPVVIGREFLFRPMDDLDPTVEEATAEPGAKRRGRPRKDDN